MDLRLGRDVGLKADQVKAPEEVEYREATPALFESHVLGPPSCRRSTQSQTDWQNCWNRAGITWSLLAVWQNRRSSEVDAFSSKVLGRRRRGTKPCLKNLLAMDGMRRVRCDQCQFGMTSVDDAGNVGPARKATGFTTNDEYIAEAVDRR